jgi:hypothetical protein
MEPAPSPSQIPKAAMQCAIGAECCQRICKAHKNQKENSNTTHFISAPERARGNTALPLHGRQTTHTSIQGTAQKQLHPMQPTQHNNDDLTTALLITYQRNHETLLTTAINPNPTRCRTSSSTRR